MNLDDLELELRKLPGVRAAGFTERDDVLLIQLQVSGDTPPPNLPLQATRIAYRHSEKPVALEVVRWRVSPEPRDHAAPGVSPLESALGSMAGIEPIDHANEPAPLAPVAVIPSVEPPAEAEAELDADAGAATAAEVDAGPKSGAVTTTVAPPAPPVRVETREQRVRLLAVLTFPDTDELEVHLTFDGRRIIGRAVASNGILGVVEAMVDGLRVFVPQLEYRPSWARVLNDDGSTTHVVACELLAPDESRRLGIASGASAIEAAARATLHALNRAISKHLYESSKPG
ncbi:MAG: hypothetical protein ACXVKA_02210 [Acidimicrobiia bacterium]